MHQTTTAGCRSSPTSRRVEGLCRHQHFVTRHFSFRALNRRFKLSSVPPISGVTWLQPCVSLGVSPLASTDTCQIAVPASASVAYTEPVVVTVRVALALVTLPAEFLKGAALRRPLSQGQSLA
jgi:hypothetical protein